MANIQNEWYLANNADAGKLWTKFVRCFASINRPNQFVLQNSQVVTTPRQHPAKEVSRRGTSMPRKKTSKEKQTCHMWHSKFNQHTACMFIIPKTIPDILYVYVMYIIMCHGPLVPHFVYFFLVVPQTVLSHISAYERLKHALGRGCAEDGLPILCTIRLGSFIELPSSVVVVIFENKTLDVPPCHERHVQLVYK